MASCCRPFGAMTANLLYESQSAQAMAASSLRDSKTTLSEKAAAESMVISLPSCTVGDGST